MYLTSDEIAQHQNATIELWHGLFRGWFDAHAVAIRSHHRITSALLKLTQASAFPAAGQRTPQPAELSVMKGTARAALEDTLVALRRGWENSLAAVQMHRRDTDRLLVSLLERGIRAAPDEFAFVFRQAERRVTESDQTGDTVAQVLVSRVRNAERHLKTALDNAPDGKSSAPADKRPGGSRAKRANPPRQRAA